MDRRGKGHVRAEAEAGMMRPQAKERLRLPEAGRGAEGVSPGAFGGNEGLPTPGFWTLRE